MHCIGSDEGGEGIIVCENRAPIAIATKRLGREKARDPCIAKTTSMASLLHPPKALCAVFKKEQIMRFGDGFDCLIIGWETKQVHTDDGFGRECACGNDRLHTAL